MQRFPLWSCTLLLACPAAAPAQEQFDPAAAAAAVAPYVDEQTIAVAHVDLQNLDFGALRKYLVELMALEPAEAAMLEGAEKTLRQWSEQWKTAGGGELFAVVSMSRLSSPFLIVAPIAPEGDGDKAIELLKQLLGGREWGFEKRAGAVVAGGPELLEQFQRQPATPRPNLAKALAAAGDAPIRLAVIPSDDVRRVIREMLPPLPEELGGAGGAQLADSVLWLSASLQLPPQVELHIVSQAEDADAAAALRRTIVAALGKLAASEQVRRLVPESEELVAQLTPQVEEDRLVLSLDPAGGAADLVDALVAPALAAARNTAQRQESQNNLKQIGVAFFVYHDQAKHFPPQAITDADGKKLLSWRVALLPYLGQEELYQQFRRDEPWNSPHNRALIPRMPDVFASPYLSRQQRTEGKTSYLGPIAEGTIIGASPSRIQDIIDGTSNTILAMEVPPASAVEWTRPADWAVDLEAPLRGLTGNPAGGFNALMADSSVLFISESVAPEILRRLFQMNDSQPVDLPQALAPPQEQQEQPVP